jgi:hypothetical protein
VLSVIKSVRALATGKKAKKQAKAKQFFFEKTNQKTFTTLGHGRWPRPSPSTKKFLLRRATENPKMPVMPAKAGIPHFATGGGSRTFVSLTEKSWMPAFAGMTGEGTGGT